MFKRLLSKLRAWFRLKVGLKFIHCETPNDILVVKRYGNVKEWEYTMEQLAEVVCQCGHYHTVVFSDSEFQRG